MAEPRSRAPSGGYLRGGFPAGPLQRFECLACAEVKRMRNAFASPCPGTLFPGTRCDLCDLQEWRTLTTHLGAKITQNTPESACWRLAPWRAAASRPWKEEILLRNRVPAPGDPGVAFGRAGERTRGRRGGRKRDRPLGAAAPRSGVAAEAPAAPAPFGAGTPVAVSPGWPRVPPEGERGAAPLACPRLPGRFAGAAPPAALRDVPACAGGPRCFISALS